MWNLKLGVLNDIDQKFLETFDRLEETDHLDGKYRLRKYSIVKKVKKFHGNSYIRLPERSFTQSSDFNKHQGDVERKFEPIEDSAIYSKTLQSCLRIFADSCGIAEDMEIEVHQMRVLATDQGQLSPEGIHQDGFDRILMLGVRRSNITGGNMLLYKSREGEALVNMPLEDGEFAILNDKNMWHNGSKPVKINPDEEGFIDFMVFLVKFS